MSGSPAAASSVGSMSVCEKISFETVPGLMTPGQRISAGHAPAALPVGVLLAAERRRAAVGPAHHLGAVVGRVHDDGVVGDAELVELVEQLADVAVVLDHAVGIDAEPGLALRLRLQVREDVHAGRVEPARRTACRPCAPCSMKSRLASRNSSSTVSMRLVVSGPVFSIFCVPSAIGPAVQHAARAELLLELGVLRVVRVLRLLLGVQVVEVAEELVEAVGRRQELVAVAEVVLAELAGDVAQRLQQVGDRRVLRLQARGRRRAGRPW